LRRQAKGYLTSEDLNAIFEILKVEKGGRLSREKERGY